MASEYLKWKYRNEKREEQRELTRSEKRKNWWHYHKWHVVTAVVLTGICVNLVWYALGRTEPDYQVAYVGENALPDDTVTAIESLFASLGEDLNGDGQIIVRLRQYPFSGEDLEMAASGQVTLMADLMECESYFFLLEDPVWFQASYQVLCLLDGTLPEENSYSADGTYLPWTDCPTLAGTDLGGYSYQLLGETVTGSSDELVSGLSLARRGFWTEKNAPYPEGCEALWNKLTEGAIS